MLPESANWTFAILGAIGSLATGVGVIFGAVQFFRQRERDIETRLKETESRAIEAYNVESVQARAVLVNAEWRDGTTMGVDQRQACVITVVNDSKDAIYDVVFEPHPPFSHPYSGQEMAAAVPYVGPHGGFVHVEGVVAFSAPEGTEPPRRPLVDAAFTDSLGRRWVRAFQQPPEHPLPVQAWASKPDQLRPL